MYVSLQLAALHAAAQELALQQQLQLQCPVTLQMQHMDTAKHQQHQPLTLYEVEEMDDHVMGEECEEGSDVWAWL